MRGNGSRAPRRFSIRSFREGDEAVLAPLFNSYTERFLGPIRQTPKSWRAQFRRQHWNAPSLGDADCCRIAEMGGTVLGYAITDYQPMWADGAAMVQEMCVAQDPNLRDACPSAENVMEALVEDAEKRALGRGKIALLLQLSAQDGHVGAAASALGYMERADDEVFMVAVTDLAGCLAELEPALTSRLGDSAFSDWRGSIKITSGEQSAGLLLGDDKVKVAPAPARPSITLTVHPDSLPLLLFGRQPIGELYSQDAASLTAADATLRSNDTSLRSTSVAHALRLLDVLFPLIPVFLPRAQWW